MVDLHLVFPKALRPAKMELRLQNLKISDLDLYTALLT